MPKKQLSANLKQFFLFKACHIANSKGVGLLEGGWVGPDKAADLDLHCLHTQLFSLLAFSQCLQTMTILLNQAVAILDISE